MEGTVLHGPRDVRFQQRDTPKILKPIDAIIEISDPGKLFDLTLPLSVAGAVKDLIKQTIFATQFRASHKRTEKRTSPW